MMQGLFVYAEYCYIDMCVVKCLDVVNTADFVQVFAKASVFMYGKFQQKI